MWVSFSAAADVLIAGAMTWLVGLNNLSFRRIFLSAFLLIDVKVESLEDWERANQCVDKDCASNN
jgi:hypothetical protein